MVGFLQPAKDVGGDLYDFVISGEKLYFAIGDVSGKGVPAALFMAKAITMFRAKAEKKIKVDRIVFEMNNELNRANDSAMFVTIFIGSLDFKDRTIEYCNAGHNPPLFLKQDHEGKSETWLQPTGPAIGLVEEATFEEGTIDLNKGDLLVLYTDGVTEAVNPQNEEFGVRRLQEVIKSQSQGSAEELMQSLRDALEVYIEGKPPEDDLTIVIGKIL